MFGKAEIQQVDLKFLLVSFSQCKEVFVEIIKGAFFYYIETFNYDMITVLACILGNIEQLKGHMIVVTIANFNFQLVKGIASTVNIQLLYHNY